uniref:Uncharacterized protein n=1 Tax=Arundo donax TaxID=35708 RepID=A0A0A9FC43_ARUDO
MRHNPVHASTTQIVLESYEIHPSVSSLPSYVQPEPTNPLQYSSSRDRTLYSRNRLPKTNGERKNNSTLNKAAASGNREVGEAPSG